MTQQRILVVDDDKIGLETLNYLLEKSNKNYQILSARSGEIALKILQQTTPDLIITDLNMPNISGIQLIKKIKADESIAHIPVLVVTGINSDNQGLETSLRIGADEFIAKPINQVELNRRIESVFKIHQLMRTIKQQKNIIQNQQNIIENIQ